MKEFLNKYNTVIFDMDGVITSEEKYWDTAALTVWEYLNDLRGIDIDTAECMRDVAKIRAEVFCGDKLIKVLKNKGLNSNWDLGYVTVLISIMLNTMDFGRIMDYAVTLPEHILEAYPLLARRCAEAKGDDEAIYDRNGKVWYDLYVLFQEWYLGEAEWGKKANHSPKEGLMLGEEPIVSKKPLIDLLKKLSKTHRLCIGTGRPMRELLPPIKNWGITECFAPDGIGAYDFVDKAQKELGATLVKPHPYIFIKAMLGTDYDDKKIVDSEYDKELVKKTLIVGDAGADILAARAMGADFCAVLTGVAGESAREYFEEMEAEYILDSVLCMEE